MNIQTKSIELSQKAQIESIRENSGNKLSANTFDSLYLWQHEMDLSIYITDDLFAVKCGQRGQDAWYFPCGSEEKIEWFIRNGMKNKGFSLCYISEKDAEWLKANFPTQWDLCREEESDEYICNIADYIGLKGGKYTGVRHKINRIGRENSITALPISDETIEDARAVVSAWDQLPHHIGMNQFADDGVSDKALSKRKQLGIDGVVVYVDGEPMSVFAGFPIDDDTVDALVGKCRHDAPNGFVYYAIREYFKQIEEKYTYCNLEEDLGIPGIRLIKEELRPEHKNPIWTAVQI